MEGAEPFSPSHHTSEGHILSMRPLDSFKAPRFGVPLGAPRLSQSSESLNALRKQDLFLCSPPPWPMYLQDEREIGFVKTHSGSVIKGHSNSPRVDLRSAGGSVGDEYDQTTLDEILR